MKDKKTKHHNDNITNHFSNRNFINDSIYYNKLNQEINKKLTARDYRALNVKSQFSSLNNNYVDGKPADIILYNNPIIIPNRKQGLDYNKNRLFDSITTDKKDIGGFYMRTGDIIATNKKTPIPYKPLQTILI